jgi:HEPN domain-containing protein
MAGYKEIAQQDFDSAVRCFDIGDYRIAVYLFQQFAEKGAKALLAFKEPDSRQMKPHLVEEILKAYDIEHAASDLSVKAKYLSGFYFNTRYPGYNYAEIVKAQADKAYEFAKELKEYYYAEQELYKINVLERINATPSIDRLMPVSELTKPAEQSDL